VNEAVSRYTLAGCDPTTLEIHPSAGGLPRRPSSARRPSLVIYGIYEPRADDRTNYARETPTGITIGHASPSAMLVACVGSRRERAMRSPQTTPLSLPHVFIVRSQQVP